jgi:hypothetical protein
MADERAVVVGVDVDKTRGQGQTVAVDVCGGITDLPHGGDPIAGYPDITFGGRATGAIDDPNVAKGEIYSHRTSLETSELRGELTTDYCGRDGP